MMTRMPKIRGRKCRSAFTLLEILVSTVIVMILLLILASITTQINTMWRYTTGRTEQFRQAREAFDAIVRRVSQATLNTYWDYDDPLAPTNYVRQSELRFISGPMATLGGTAPRGAQWPTHGIFFQAPLGAAQPGQTELSGLNSLLNTWGYFIEFGSDSAFRPVILDGKVEPHYRFRLFQFIEPADKMSLYGQTSGQDPTGKPRAAVYNGTDWFRTGLQQTDDARPVHLLGSNIIALVILPRLTEQEDATGTALAPDYFYDTTVEKTSPQTNSRNQLPPLVQITMVVLDEASAIRLEDGTTMPALGLETAFRNAAELDNDIALLEGKLRDQRLSYRIFTATVALKEAKWSNH